MLPIKQRTFQIIAKTSLVVLALLLIGWASYETWLLNIHPVIPNKIYRSAQLSPKTLEYFLVSKHIKTVINLRGTNPDQPWYQKELKITQAQGVQYYSVKIPSYQLPSITEIRKLTYLLLVSPQPILIHCRGGADRSGFVSAVAMILYHDAPLNQSENQFSVTHFVTSDDSIGKLVFPYYTRWLKQHHLQHNRQHFIRWICSDHPLGSRYSNSQADELTSSICRTSKLTVL